MEAARGQSHGSCSIREEFPACFIRRGDTVEQVAISFGVRTRAVAVVAVGLDLARSGDAQRNFGAPFSGWRQSQVGCRDGRNFDVKIDSIEQRARYARLVIGGAARRTAARKRGVAEMTAAAWVHRGDQLHTRGKGHV